MHIFRMICSFIPVILGFAGFSQSPVATTYCPTKDYEDKFISSKHCFIENCGQVTDQYNHPRQDILYTIPASGGLNIFIGQGSVHYQFATNHRSSKLNPADKSIDLSCILNIKNNNSILNNDSLYRMDINLLGMNNHCKVSSELLQEYTENNINKYGTTNGLISKTYKKITFHDVYPNIDWTLYFRNGKLEHEFIIRDGGNPADIRLQYAGATNLSIENDGSLKATTPMGVIAECAPVAYQLNGEKVSSKFILSGNVLTYETGNYSGELVVDPTVEWSTYFGGSAVDQGMAVTTDSSGNVYLTGKTSSTSHIATTGSFMTLYGGGASNVFIAKFDTTGALKWSTYFGGDGEDEGNGICTDAAGNIFITGFTTSSEGIASPGSYQITYGGGPWDAFLAKFNPSGGLIWSTYFGGTGADYGIGLIPDGAGNIFITGATTSSNAISTSGVYQPTLGGEWDAFLAKFSSSGNLVWSTYYGGTGLDFAQSAVIDNSNNIYISGSTSSGAGIATSGAYQSSFSGGDYDVFVSKFNSSGNLLWGTYYGGTGSDECNSLCTDGMNNVYLTGFTASTSGIASPGAYQTSLSGGKDAFLAKFNSSGNFKWGTYFGGASDDFGESATADNNGNIYISGYTSSTSGIATPGSFQTEYGGGGLDAFVSQFNNAGFLLWSTYIGGADSDLAIGVATDNHSYLYIAGYTESNSGISKGSAFQPGNNGDFDAFLMQIKGCTPFAGVITGQDSICLSSSTILAVSNAGGIWNESNANCYLSGGIVFGIKPGVDSISYSITNTCGSDTAYHVVVVNPIPTVTPVFSQVLCSETTTENITFSGTDGAGFLWTNSNPDIGIGSSGSGDIAPFLTSFSTSLMVAVFTVTPAIGICLGPTITFSVTVNPIPVLDTVPNLVICNGNPSNTIIFTGTAGTSYSWTNSNTGIGLPLTGTGNIPTFTGINLSTTVETAVITVTPSNATCTGQSGSFTVSINPTPVALPVSSHTFCSGLPTDAINFSGTPLSNFYWVNSNIYIGLNATDTGDIPSFIATNRDTAIVNSIITVTPFIGNCTGSVQIFTITVNPMPTVSVSIANQQVCNDSLTNPLLFTGNISGTTYFWENTNDTIGLEATGIGNIPSFVANNNSSSAAVAFIIVTPSANNCNGTSQTFSIKINPSAEVGRIYGQDSVCAGSYTILTDSLSNGIWKSYDESMAIVTDGVVSGLVSGTDTIFYTVSNECGSATAAKVINIDNCDNNGNTNNSHVFNLYPNPAQNEIEITSVSDIELVEMFDLLGQKISTINCKSKKIVCNISDLANGIYLVRINSSYIAKIVKD